MRTTCPTHKRKLIVYCPACRGAKGGAKMTPAQLRRNRKAAKLGGRPRNDD